MLRDRRRFESLLRAARVRETRGGAGHRPFDWARLERDIEASIARVESRRASVPKLTYPAELPVVERREEIAQTIREHQVVVLCGETGSGKTTQIPKICLEIGRGVQGLIGHTQPRRIAARSVAARIAEEIGSPLGRLVGSKIRFSDQTSSETLIKLMTDGVLLAEAHGGGAGDRAGRADALLESYDTIIIDEAHERSLNIDFLLGYLRRLLPRRPDLKLIITSATIDPQRFSAHFGGAPIIEVSGRMYPVEVRHKPIESAEDEPDEDEPEMQDAILHAVQELCREAPPPSAAEPGDILIFHSGEREIRKTTETLRKHIPASAGRLEILPLFSRLSTQEQDRVFDRARAPGARRVILATNVAETSLTVPGIRYVVDPGYARISRYSPRTKVQRLPIEKVSRASADQRKGRCGRLADGVCIRLYGRSDFESRPLFTDPEILRTNLASVILQMKILGLLPPGTTVEDFPFLDPPDPRNVRDAFDTLRELGALDEKEELTPIGRDMARLPTDPRIARMVLAAREEGCIDEMLVIASALSVQDPRERPSDARDEADAAHRKFHDDPGDVPALAPRATGTEGVPSAAADAPGGGSDFLGYLRLWDAFHEQQRRTGSSALRRWCREHFLSHVRLREWMDVHQQLRAVVDELPPVRSPADASSRHAGRSEAGGRETDRYALVHKALLTGLLSNIGVMSDKFEYAGTRGLRFNIHPGSSLFRTSSKWVVAAELVKTTKLYARTVARVSPGWIEKAAAHLVKRTYHEPHWNERTGQVWAYERVTLFGLELVARRHVPYGPIDPEASRQIFIHRALVEGEYWSNQPFMAHNREVMKTVQKTQAKLRRNDLMAGAQAQFEFYEKRLPKSVFSGQAFEQWAGKNRAEAGRELKMTEEDLLVPGAEPASVERFPEGIEVGGVELPLTYRYEPGHPEDGLTLTVPLALLPHVPADRCQWLVPGMVAEKIVALIRTLPKHLRRSFVPAPEVAAKVAASLDFGRGSFLDVVARELERLGGIEIPRSGEEAWRPQEVPDHLVLRYRVVDAQPPATDGPELGAGRDLADLRRALRDRLEVAFAAEPDPQWNREGVTRWDFGDLPEEVEVRRGSLVFKAHPAVVDRPGPKPGVALRLMESKEAAARATDRGVRRLALLGARDEILFLIRNLPTRDRLLLAWSAIGQPRDFDEGLADLIAARAFLGSGQTPRRQKEFEARIDSGWHRLGSTAGEAAKVVGDILEAHHALLLRLAAPLPTGSEAVAAEVRAHAARLLSPGFLLRTPPEWLTQLPRFLRADRSRLDKLGNRGLSKDRELMGQIAGFEALWARRHQDLTSQGLEVPALERFRWLLEEFRVSLFAQELGTSEPVSVKRLERQWEKVVGSAPVP